MIICTNIPSLNRALTNSLSAGLAIGFVPTMGALHVGHISLLKQAKFETDITVVSIFVNPTQFNSSEDLSKYPRTESADIEILDQNGCDIVFIPNAEEMYPQGIRASKVDYGTLTASFEGAFRPGHFNGVVAIVSRLFEIVNPSKAYFGEKDFQQLAVIRKMVEVMDLTVEVVGCSIVRSQDGLALSSRNQRLSSQGLHRAVEISSILSRMCELVGVDKIDEAIAFGKSRFNEEEDFVLEYLEVVDPDSFEKLLSIQPTGQAVILVAAYLEGIRLIDNMKVSKVGVLQD